MRFCGQDDDAKVCRASHWRLHAIVERGILIGGLSIERATISYAAFFACAYLLGEMLGAQRYVPYVILFVNLACYAFGHAKKAALFSSFLLGNELASIVSILMGSLAFGEERRSALRGIRPLRFGASVWCSGFLLISVTSLASLALGTVVNALASIAYYALIGFVFYRLRGVSSRTDLVACVVCFAYSEAAIVSLSVVRYGFGPSDFHCGSLGNAHFLGLWCCLSVLALLVYGRRIEADSRRLMPAGCIVAIGILFVLLLLSDTKAPVLCGAFAIVVTLVVQKLFPKGTIVVPLVVFTVVFVAAVLALGVQPVESSLTRDDAPGSNYFSIYVYDESTAIKYDYFSDTIDDLFCKGGFVTGYGLGQYGSRFANLFGYTYTYRNDNAINRVVAKLVESRMLSSYAEHAARYNDIEEIGQYSVVLISPFSSFLALLAEGGLVGFVFLCSLLRALRLSRGAQVILMFFVGCCLVDMYLDHIQLAAMLAVVLGFDCCVQAARDNAVSGIHGGLCHVCPLLSDQGVRL